MKKICLIALVFILCMAMALPSFAAKTHKESTLGFAECTTGAEAAWDGKDDTAFEGSITGKFAKRSVLTGMTVKAGKTIHNLKVYGSEDGSEWIELYSVERIRSLYILGSNGSGSYTDEMYDNMYTYAITYLRIEMEYGSISDLKLHGYEVDVTGKIAKLDASYGKGGYESSGSYYDDNRGHYMLDHVIGSADRGDVVTFPDSQNKYAYLTLKLEKAQKLTAIAFVHKTKDNNSVRWNGVKFEISADGSTWKTVETLPADFSTRFDLSQRTVVLIPINDSAEYCYVRISSTTASMSIGAVDVYADATAPSINTASMLNGWEGNPYKGVEAPKEETSKEQTTDANVDEQTTSAAAETEAEKSGCGSSIAASFGVAALVTAAVAVASKKRSKEN